MGPGVFSGDPFLISNNPTLHSFCPVHSFFYGREPGVSEFLNVLQAPLQESPPLRTSFRVPAAFHLPLHTMGDWVTSS